jgi:hypothetical protein
MAKLAETLVIEYLSRTGYLSTQSIKKGNNEWDILAIKYEANSIQANHIEVQVSFNPVSYLSKSNAKQRSDEQVNSDMEAWVQKKFKHPILGEICKAFYSGNWSHALVYGVIKDQRELNYLQQHGIELIPFAEVINTLCSKDLKDLAFTSETKDLVEILRYAIDQTQTR